MEVEKLEIEGVQRTLKIHYEKRDNCTVTVRKKTINIRIPSSLSNREKKKQLKSMKEWAVERIKKEPERFKPPTRKEYENNDTLILGSEKYKIKISYKDKSTSSGKIEKNKICLSLSDNLSEKEKKDQTSALISRCLGRKKLPEFEEKIRRLNERYFNRSVNKVYFKNNKSNWGSCSEKGNINLSTKILFAPEDVQRYVCIHELAHLIEPNHSEKFWSLVERAEPDYKEKRRWLKENNDECIF